MGTSFDRLAVLSQDVTELIGFAAVQTHRLLADSEAAMSKPTVADELDQFYNTAHLQRHREASRVGFATVDFRHVSFLVNPLRLDPSMVSSSDREFSEYLRTCLQDCTLCEETPVLDPIQTPEFTVLVGEQRHAIARPSELFPCGGHARS